MSLNLLLYQEWVLVMDQRVVGVVVAALQVVGGVVALRRKAMVEELHKELVGLHKGVEGLRMGVVKKLLMLTVELVELIVQKQVLLSVKVV